MEFFMQDNTSTEVDKIMAQLKSYMDGEISQQMRKSGLDYKLNFGVSMFWIRKIAAEYNNNQALADRLWLREARETMIIASIIANAESFDTEKLNHWFSMIKTNELAEQFGVYLLSKVNNSETLSMQYAQSDNSYKKTAAWASLSTLAKSKELKETSDLIDIAFADITNDSLFVQRTKGRFLRTISRKSSVFLDTIESKLTVIKDEKSVAFLAQELQTEIDFLREK